VVKPATPGGSISGTILGNDQIVCASEIELLVVTAMKDSVHPLRDGEAFVICSASSTLTTCSNPVVGTFNLVSKLSDQS
jgi:hypothetical protein